MNMRTKAILHTVLCVVLCIALGLTANFTTKKNNTDTLDSLDTNKPSNLENSGENTNNKDDKFEEWGEGFSEETFEETDGDSDKSETTTKPFEEKVDTILDNKEPDKTPDFSEQTEQVLGGQNNLAGTTTYQPLVINNNQPYLNENFLGFNGIYMLFTHMSHPTYGFSYTDEQATLELDRVKEMGVKIVRTTYSSGMVYNQKDGIWHWDDSPYLNSFIKTAKELKKRDIDVAFTFTWYLGNFTESTFQYYFPDGYFPAGITSTGWGSTYSGTSGQSEAEIEAIRTKQAVSGYKKFVKASVEKFRAEGLTNFKYIFGFTECNNTYMVNNVRDYDKICRVFDIGITATHEALEEMGLRDEYKIVGPCDNWGGDFNENDEEKYSRLVEYTLQNLTEEVDIIGTHNGYDRGETFEEDDFYARNDRKVGNAMRSALSKGKEFWIDEWNVATDISYSQEEKRGIYDDPMSGVAFGAMVNGVMNMGGVSNVFIWMLSEQQWPNDQHGGEFDQGVQIGSGYMPNLYESSIPRAGWYSYAMIQKFVGQGKLVMCNDGASPKNQSRYYYSCIERDDGEITVVVTNYQSTSFPVEISFQNSLGGRTFYRHIYSTTTVNPTAEAVIPGVSGIAENVNTSIKDTLQPLSVTVYTTDNYGYNS